MIAITPESGAELRLPKLRPDQYAIAESDSQIKVVACGRRWGKSLTARTIAFIIAAAGGRVAWVVPTYKNAKSTWREAELVAKGLENFGVTINKTEKTIEFPNGGFVGIYSADNADALRGDSFHLVVLDEAAFMSEDVFTEVSLPLIADTGGTLMAIGTPRGRNWFHALYQDGLPGPNKDPDIQSWHAPTHANPDKRVQKWIKMAKRKMPEDSFRQEVLAEFLETGGAVFKNVDSVCIGKPLLVPLIGHRYVCGVDLAKLKDFTVFSVFDVITGHQVHVERYQRVPYHKQAAYLAALHRIWHFQTIVVEQNNVGEQFIEQCEPFHLPIERFLTKNDTKGAIIMALVVAFEKYEENKFVLLDDPIQREEFKIFEQSLTPSGLPKYGAPEHKHDDHVIAAAVAFSKVRPRKAAGIGWWNGKIA